MRENNKGNLGKFGIWATIFYTIAVLSALGVMFSNGWLTLGPIRLNEIGDLLAGLFGPLAIFWLILGFLQQGEELRNSVATLELQAKELASSVEQQKELNQLNKELILHEKEMAAQQEATRNEKLIPNLVPYFFRQARGLNAMHHHLNIRNLGGTLNNISVVVLYHGKPVISETATYVLERGSFTIEEVDINEVLPPGTPVTLEIACENKLGQRYEVIFDLSCHKELGLGENFLAKMRSRKAIDSI